MNDFNQNLIDEFRANGGRVSGPMAGAPLLLLTTVGARSGEIRTTPLVYARDGERYVIFASKAGAPNHPAWYHNLVSNPRATVEMGDEKFEVIATPAEGEERDRLYAQQAALMPTFNEYQQKIERVIPVVLLERVG